MPPGSGTDQVTGKDTRIGDFPTGKTRSLGNLRKSNAINALGATDYPRTTARRLPAR